MKKWHVSFITVIILNILSLINFIARALLDWRYVYPFFVTKDSNDFRYMAIFYLFLLGIWFLSLMIAAQANKIGLIIMVFFNLLFLFGTGVGTYFYFCPFPCTVIWPISEIINWSNMLFGLLTTIVSVNYLLLGNKNHNKTIGT